jgi:hypothetical protein
MEQLDAQSIQAERLGSRVLTAATVAYGVLGAVALVGFGTLPAASETGPQVVTWFHENANSVRYGVWSFTVAAPPFALMVVLLRRLLPSPHRDMFLFGAVAYTAEIGVWSWFWAGLALHPDQLQPAMARAILDVGVFMGPVLTASTTTMMAPVTLLALRGQSGIPRWLGALGLIAFLEQSVETITIFGSTGFTQPGGAMNMQLGAGLTFVWILAFGFWGGFRGRVS